MTGNGAVMKRRIKEGTGQFPMDCPMEDSRLQIHYRFETLPSMMNMQLCTSFEPCANSLHHCGRVTRKLAKPSVNVDTLQAHMHIL